MCSNSAVFQQNSFDRLEFRGWPESGMTRQQVHGVLVQGVLRKFLLAFSVASLLFSALVAAMYQQDIGNQRLILEQEAEHVLDLQQELLVSEMRQVEADLLFLASQNILQNFLLETAQSRQRLENEYIQFAVRKAVFDQVRLLDSDGMEVVRVNYRDGDARAVSEDDLQPKSERYYYQQARHLSKGEVFVSPFDLNMEYGRIERPIQPVIRFATPVCDESGEMRGILVLNYLGTRLLARFRQISMRFEGRSMLLNPDGEYLQLADSQKEWGWLLGHHHSFRSDYPAAWNKWNLQGMNRVRVADDLFMLRRISPGYRLAASTADAQVPEASTLILVSYLPASGVILRSRRLLNRLLLAAAGVLPVIALFAFYWARAGEMKRQHDVHVAESEARLRHLSTALLETQESERRSLSRVLHDEVGQLATAIRLDLGSLRRKQSDSDEDPRLQRAIQETDQVLHSLHEIASRLRPSVLDDLGLEDAIVSYVAEYEQRTGVAVSTHLLFDQDGIPAKTGENAYRIIVEALANVTAHSDADEVEVLVSANEATLEINVSDTGSGFDLRELEVTKRLGILGMRERADLLGGEFDIASDPGNGTQILVTLPLQDCSFSSSDSEEA